MSTPPFFRSSFYFCLPFLHPFVPPSFLCFFPSLFSIQLKCFLKYIGISQAHMQIHSTLLFSNIDGLNAYFNLFCHWTEQRFPVVTFLPQCLLLFKFPIKTAIRAQLTPDLCNSANTTAPFQVLGMCGHTFPDETPMNQKAEFKSLSRSAGWLSLSLYRNRLKVQGSSSLGVG